MTLTIHRRALALAAVAAAALVAGCVPDTGTPPTETTTTTEAPTTTTTTSTTTSTTTTTTIPDPNAVSGVQLTWAYSQYAQYGVFGAWSQVASAPNAVVNLVNGQDVTGLPAEAAKTYTQAQFDNGVGSIDPVTGEGTISWDTGDWVLNAYNGQFGAPDETLRDPILDIEANGSGTLSFEAYIPPALDMSGNPAPAAGPTRIDIVTFDNVDQILPQGLKITPDFAGRSFTPSIGSPWVPCEVEGVPTGGSWPAAWINFVPTSVQAHYYTTSCGGLNARKPPVPFTVSWGTAPAGITTQPTLTSTSVWASSKLSAVGAKIGVTGTPTPAIQWQRTLDGTTWTDVADATGTQLTTPLTAGDNGASFRALVAGSIESNVIGPVTVNTRPTNIVVLNPPDLTVGRGDRAQFLASIEGAPTPTVTWERSDDGGATWGPVGSSAYITNTLQAGGLQTQLLIPATTDADNGAKFRVRADNGLGDPTEKVSETATLTVQWAAPVIETNPVSRPAFVGQTASFSAGVTGLPTATYQWEVSADGGATWTNWSTVASPGTNTGLTLAAADVTAALNGNQFRLRATNAAGTSVSGAATLTVVTPAGGKELLVFPNTPIDATQPTTITVIGAGFAPPTTVTSAMRLLITDSTKWQPGQNGNQTGAVQNVSLTAASLRSGGGFVFRQFTVAANVLNPALSYGVATFGNTATERFYDAWTPLTVVTP